MAGLASEKGLSARKILFQLNDNGTLLGTGGGGHHTLSPLELLATWHLCLFISNLWKLHPLSAHHQRSTQQSQIMPDNVSKDKLAIESCVTWGNSLKPGKRGFFKLSSSLTCQTLLPPYSFYWQQPEPFHPSQCWA